MLSTTHIPKDYNTNSHGFRTKLTCGFMQKRQGRTFSEFNIFTKRGAYESTLTVL